jgi:hypothetical protein
MEEWKDGRVEGWKGGRLKSTMDRGRWTISHGGVEQDAAKEV